VSTLKAVRQARGLSREKVAARIGYSAKQLERWEKGTSPVKDMHLLALASVYQVDVSELKEAA
jgi:transcriptional regulator with XRE-family HTH domain